MFFFVSGRVRGVITCLYIFGGNCFSLAILCPVSPRCILKVPTQTSVILERHSRLQSRRRLFVLRTTSKTRYFSSNVDAPKSRLASTHLTVEHPFFFPFLCGVSHSLGGRHRLSPWHLCWPPPFHKCTSCGIGGAGVPLLTTHNCFSALVEREHELFSDSSHFDILLYPKEFVFWHCVLCILVYFPSFFGFVFPGGFCYSSAQLFYFLSLFSPPVLSLLLVVSDAVFDCLIAIRIVELERSCPVPWMERSKSLVVRGGVMFQQPPPQAEGCLLTVIAIMWYVFFFF